MDVDFDPEDPGHGSAAFSTYQARILRDLARSEKPLAFLDLHSGARTLMVPWGNKPYESVDYPDQKRVLQAVADKMCADCAMGSNRNIIGYENPGEIIDHMYAREGIKYSMLWEVFDGFSSSLLTVGAAGASGCFSQFNPAAKEFEETVASWSSAIGVLADFVRQNVTADERSTKGAEHMRPPESSAVENTDEALAQARRSTSSRGRPLADRMTT
eukprot:TRINITY_DN6430_c0_g1_i1.p1 TRINITY_DN6430_c0_g1~~TRINITY_DN6430_c0_g1_i1.p1  ORF type:complete len:215 (+),score=27.38 TRINITY_DN6430_c0_g1_i1:384-1028(+)